MNWTLIAVIGIFVIFSIVGFRKGIVRMILNLAFSIIGTVAATICTIQISKHAHDKYSAVVYVVIFILIMIACVIIGAVINRIAKLPVIRVANDLAGLVVGFCQGYIIISVVMLVIMMLDGYDWTRGVLQDIESNRFLSFLYNKNIWLMLAQKYF